MTEASQPTVASNKHQRNIEKAAERRQRDTFVVPTNAMIRLGDIPASKKRDKIIEGLGAEFTSMDAMVPDPRRGMKLIGHALKLALQRREEQEAKIAKKRTQRRNFRALSKGEQRMHREAGAKHVKPGQLHLHVAENVNKTQQGI